MYPASIVWHDAFETHLGRYVTHVLFPFIFEWYITGWIVDILFISSQTAG